MRGCSCDLRLLLLFIICSVSVRGASVSGFRICAYNLQNFTPEKASNLQMLHTLTRFLSRYDICLLQHVVDPDGTAIKALVSKLNSASYSYDKHIYKSVSSRALGKSSDNMQQYVFLYRTRTVNITGQHQYTGQSFVRPPFVVQFQSNKTEINQFVLVPLHSDEDQVIQEIDWLYDVFEEVSRKWNNTNVMFLGDFHASCAYVTRANRKNIRLYTNNSFSWMIDEKEDTTVTDTTNCAYDRIVVHGQPFLRAIVPGSGQVNKFKFRRYKPSTEKVLAISSHYPVEVQLKSSAPLLQATPLLILAVIVCFRL